MLAMRCNELTLPLLPKNPLACKRELPLHSCTGKVPLLLMWGGRNTPVCKGHYPSIAALATCWKALLPLKNIHTISTNTDPYTNTYAYAYTHT
jgi:hypothetical protein